MIDKYNWKFTEQWSFDPNGAHTLQSNIAKGSEVKTESKVVLPRVASTTWWFKERVLYILENIHVQDRSQLDT